MKPYRLLLTLVTLCTLLIVATPVSAQDIDLGNDGIDMDCDDFPERNAVEGYFAHDGGSADRNVDDLDPDGDGIPCNEAIDDGGEEPEYVPPVVGDEPQTDPEPGDGGNAVQHLPNTGVGDTRGEFGTDVAIAVMLTVVALCLMAGALSLRCSTR